MDPRKLRHFLAIVEYGSFTKASEALIIAQPSLSQSIRALEQEIGSPLFRRLPRSLEITAAGEALLGPARRVLRALEDAAEAVNSVVGLRTGRLDIIAPRSLLTHPTSEIIAAFRQDFPGISVNVSEAADSAQACMRVNDGFAECAIVEMSAIPKGLSVTPLLEYEVVAAFPPSFSEEVSAGSVMDQLAQLPLIGSPHGTVSRGILVERGLDANVVVELPSVEGLMELVVADVGAAIVVESHARGVDRGVRIASLEPVTRRRVGIAVGGSHPSPAAVGFRASALARYPLAMPK